MINIIRKLFNSLLPNRMFHKVKKLGNIQTELDALQFINDNPDCTQDDLKEHMERLCASRRFHELMKKMSRD
jgi:hypothetical protein